MKPKLIILSDLWGRQKSDWIVEYTKRLSNIFDIKYYDCCELGKIDVADFNEVNLHKQFIKSGIDIASKRLVSIEHENIHILAFSIGGTIAWKAGLNGFKIDSLYTISSTRLRNETLQPNGNITVFFGELDNHKPKTQWFEKMNISSHIIKNKKHEMYKEAEVIHIICNTIIAHCS